MKLPLFDAHCDTISAILRTDSELCCNNLHIDMKRSDGFFPYAQFFAIFAQIKPDEKSDDLNWLLWRKGNDAFAQQYGVFIREMERNRRIISFCKCWSDAEKAFSEGKKAAFLSIEGAEIIDCSIEKLEKVYNQGVRAIILTWNFQNKLSGSNDEGYSNGLTQLGRNFVKRCQELGIIVDVSHLSEPGFWDVIEIAEKPIIASHSNSKTIWPNKRNLTDRQFMAIAKTGGVAGINLYTDFLGEKPDINKVTEHIEHFLQLGGEKNIAIGADLDGCDTLPEGISGIEDIYKIAENLLKKNYTEALVYDIFYNNLKRVVMEICDT